MSEQADLESLRYHWGSAYQIWHSGGRWSAVPYDLPSGRLSNLHADSADELRRLIRADYRPTQGSQSR